MNYRFFSSIFYEDPELYERTLKKRLEGESTVHLPFSIIESPAFCVLTVDICNLIAKIYKTDKIISKLIDKLPDIAISHFTKRCLVDEIVLTNSIEGVTSTRRDIHLVLDNLKSQDHTNRFQGLVLKYMMLNNQENLSLTSCSDIRQIYDDLVLDEVTRDNPQNFPDGTFFRKESVSVYSSTQKELHRGMYPESAIIIAMEDALLFVNDPQYDLLLRVAVFHYLIGYIHPFYDGNGRLSRFLSSYLLSRELEPLTGYRLSYTIKEHIKLYHDSFKICNHPRNKGDLTPFVLMFLNIVHLSEEQLLDAISTRKLYLDKCSRKAEQLSFIGDLNSPIGQVFYLLIQATLFSEDGISTKELLETLHISRSTLTKRLKVFENKGLLQSKKEGREAFYSLEMNAFDDLVFHKHEQE